MVDGTAAAGMIAPRIARSCICKSNALGSNGCTSAVYGYAQEQPLRGPAGAQVEAGVMAAQLTAGQAGMVEPVGQGEVELVRIVAVVGAGVVFGLGEGPTSAAGICIMLEMELRLFHCHKIRTQRAAIWLY